MKEIFTFDQLKKAWESYRTDKVMKVLKGGKWYTVPTGTKLEEGVTEAQVVTFSNAMSFPWYLEKHYG